MNGTPKWIISVALVALSHLTGFTIWATTSIFHMKERLAVQQVQINTQIATIATFQNILGDIRTQLGDIQTSVEVTKTMLEERTNRKSD